LCGRATVKLQLDINFGDPVTPAPVRIAYPSLREGQPPVAVWGYPSATVLAEKLCTAVDLGAANSRLRDYADIWTLTRLHDMAADEVHAALAATAAHRGVLLRPCPKPSTIWPRPEATPTPLSGAASPTTPAIRPKTSPTSSPPPSTSPTLAGVSDDHAPRGGVLAGRGLVRGLRGCMT
jgi:hypothetical protein